MQWQLNTKDRVLVSLERGWRKKCGRAGEEDVAALEVGRNKSARMLRLSVLSVLGITGSPTQRKGFTLSEICSSWSCIICWLNRLGRGQRTRDSSLMMRREWCNQLPPRKDMKHVPKLMSYTGSANKVHSDFSIRRHRKTQPKFLAHPIWLASNQTHNPQNLWFVT